MKKIVFAFMLLLANVAIAQPAIIHGVSLQTAELNEEIKGEYIWNNRIPMDFVVIMHKDTITMNYPRQVKKYITSEYKKIDDTTSEWKAIDESGNNCWVYLMSYPEAVFIRIEYDNRAYYVELQEYELE
jgi:hypothetical protein